ncbi:hypothetical protein DCAR_0312986 [Daucus carota subsp. sativus]|uniref:RING-type domain-containing protein n=1 Tax=Daucus carota subsp. sativus TaxID=79200 RepID=A0A166BQ15_DAUCS|nr:PREDICTED: RING-H2 finger protein ATL40-like [Daucus carota subsp. sativus]WOG93700.1 hypothetical protein DCAR_0312986 [Daucus carota subsp. sativus]
MAAISQFFHNLYTISIVFLTLLFLELLILLRSISGVLDFSGNSPVTAAQFFKLIERKNPASRYKAGLKDEVKECAVCLSVFEERQEIRKVKQCNHTFHKQCLDTWLQQDCPTCPLCRISVLPEEVVARYRRQRNNQEYYYGSDEEMMVLLSALHGNYLRRLAH